mmetsp:Transcript_44185/g.134532  ORF Transcript_44185/g.134532 Transcript_44185/m.134532 type:complete len:331 (-) Transcript_44185:904-1896(-)
MSPLSITHGSRMSSRGFGTDDEHPPTEEQAGSTPRRHRMYVELRGLDGNSRGRRLEDVIEPAVVAGDVRGCSSHVESNDRHGFFPIIVAITGTVRRLGVPDHAPGRTRQYRLMSSEIVHGGQSAVGFHEIEPYRRQSRVESTAEGREVVGNFGGEVRGRARRLTSGHHLDHGHNLAAERHLVEASHLSRDVPDNPFVLVVRVRVGQYYRDGLDALVRKRLQLRPHGLLVRFPQDHHLFPREALDTRSPTRRGLVVVADVFVDFVVALLLFSAGGGTATTLPLYLLLPLILVPKSGQHDPFVHLGHVLVQHVRSATRQIENIIPALISDPQ